MIFYHGDSYGGAEVKTVLADDVFLGTPNHQIVETSMSYLLGWSWRTLGAEREQKYLGKFTSRQSIREGRFTTVRAIGVKEFLKE